MKSRPAGGPQPWRRAVRLPVAAVAAMAGLAPHWAMADANAVAAQSAAMLPLYATEADDVDARQRDTMPMTTSAPWGAVGFVDNGCTGTLIDSQHVLAASHCFTFDYDGTTAAGVPYLQGAWQGRLVFFPNYHPARVNPPRIEIDRVIVGSRVQTDPAQPSVAADWGIGHLASPVSGFPTLLMSPMERWRLPAYVSFAGYARDASLYPNGAASYPQPAPGGYCPNFGNNCWWIPALIDPRCLAIDSDSGIVRLDDFSCLIQGGNSGSPVIWNTGSGSSPAWRLTGVISGGGGYWSAERFQFAPRFASGIAIASDDDGNRRTQVFATDQDLGRVASRRRTAADAAAPFAYFRDLGAVTSPRSIAAFQLSNGHPQVVVANGGKNLYTNFVTGGGSWNGWQILSGPAGVSGIIDVAASLNVAGLPQLFVVGADHALYTRRAKMAGASVSWEAWQKLSVGAKVKRIAAVRHGDGRLQIFAVSTSGRLRSRWQVSAAGASTWSAATAFGGSLPSIVDVDAAWAGDGSVQVFAVDEHSDTWSRKASGTSALGSWNAWAAWSVPLYAPKAATPPKLDGIVTLTAGRWLEGGSSVLPVVFATDSQGNIYVTTYERGVWKPWRSFYN